jgi:tripartite-type tricarboxylate transporter receptor subunit TctC
MRGRRRIEERPCVMRDTYRNLPCIFAAAGAAVYAVLLATPCAAQPASTGSGQAYPNRPIRFVVPFSPGGNADTLTRTASQKVAESIGQQVVIDNRSGANGNIGMEIVARAAPDGYTLVLGYIANVAIAPSLVSKLPYDPVKDYEPITLLATSPNIIVVHPTVNARTLKELIALSKAKPKSINFSSAGVASVGHLTGELFNTVTGSDLQHVPYKGSGQGVIDLVAGQIQMLIGGMSSVMPHIKAGRLRAIAVTGTQRSPAMPDIPTVAESLLPGFEATAWYCALAPAKTPRPIAARLQSEFAKALALPEVKQRLENLGFEIVASTPDALAAYIKSEIIKWAKVVKASGAKAE